MRNGARRETRQQEHWNPASTPTSTGLSEAISGVWIAAFNTSLKMNKPQETIADFKHRIALMMRNKEGGKVYSIIGAARPHPCTIRKTTKPLDNTNPDGILTA
jgi:hypothetical protein